MGLLEVVPVLDDEAAFEAEGGEADLGAEEVAVFEDADGVRARRARRQQLQRRADAGRAIRGGEVVLDVLLGIDDGTGLYGLVWSAEATPPLSAAALPPHSIRDRSSTTCCSRVLWVLRALLLLVMGRSHESQSCSAFPRMRAYFLFFRSRSCRRWWSRELVTTTYVASAVAYHSRPAKRTGAIAPVRTSGRW